MRLLRGEISNLINGGAYVIIPEYGDDEFGPMEILNQATVARGDRVIVGQVSRAKEDLVVLGKVTSVDG
ncbi:hypothetical protein PBI_CANTARE_28 [Brevibacterium phage Cantare]|uniref:Uncharacterized protein n=1 Tax=Brevibacterium phage Cantare TaxID=2338395 RepID=A0A3G3LYP9_9CAUD|nr:hypothetical protein PQD70_gp028 [Brevibacterium phage Cantare]AYQ99248.1 hypothetical protein PBI_CANTARE_28 [Brevibacterium phage Cantare]